MNQSYFDWQEERDRLRAEEGAKAAKLSAAEKRVAELTKALELTVDVMLRNAGWNINCDKYGKELPMTRPDDVQKAEAIARQALAGRVEG